MTQHSQLSASKIEQIYNQTKALYLKITTLHHAKN